jgi:eukaryotic-like serine/threonine-protein kinase
MTNSSTEGLKNKQSNMGKISHLNSNVSTRDSNIGNTQQIHNLNPVNRSMEDEIRSMEEKFKFKIVRKLGSGGFSNVFLAVSGNKQFAVKILKIESELDEDKMSKRIIWAKNEKIVTMNLKNKNCIRCLNTYESNQTHALFLELAANGDLGNLTASFYEKRLFKFNVGKKIGWLNYMSESLIKFYFNQVVKSLEYLRQMGSLHNDIKLENLLLTHRNQIKLSDFALSSFIPNTGRYEISSAGTLLYMPPESLDKNNRIINSKDAFKIDYYALGVIFYRMLFGEFILENNYKKYDEDTTKIDTSKKIIRNFSHEDLEEKLELITENKFYLNSKRKDNFFSQEAKKLLQSLLKKEIKERADLKDIVSHPWLKSKQEKIKIISEIYEGDSNKFLLELQKVDYLTDTKSNINQNKNISGAKETIKIKEQLHHFKLNSEKKSSNSSAENKIKNKLHKQIQLKRKNQ